jgi:hypothetical protein
MLAVADRLEHQVLRDGIAADQLDHDLHVVASHDLEGIVRHARFAADEMFRSFDGLVGDD